MAKQTLIMATSDSEEHGATARVFDITELGEKILLELPMEVILLRATRVCKQWKAIIDNSLALQQALFFKPITGPPKLFLACVHVNSGGEDHPPREMQRYSIKINPLWRKQRKASLRGLRWLHPMNSYHRMLFSQPPVYSLGMFGSRDKNGLKLDFMGSGSTSAHLLNEELAGVVP